MRIAVDISLYPLRDEYLPPIKDVIARLHAHEDIDVVTNPLSTQLLGEYATVMNALQDEIATTFEQIPKAVFTIRILNHALEH